jgi:hypothetical protein
MSLTLPFLAPEIVTVPASSRIAAYSDGQYTVTQLLNGDTLRVPLFSGVGAYTSDALAAAARIEVSGGARFPLYYSVGVSAFITELPSQITPGALDATGALTVALLSTRIVTSSTAAAVTATLPTGAVMDLGSSFSVNDSFDWTAINTGGSNAFTVTAATGHTIVGAGAVAASTSGTFRTRKTAADTFVTYRL